MHSQIGERMIVLEKSTPRPSELRGAAGFDAEEKLAYYLRRGFAVRRDVFVFNDLHLSHECADRTERAQIDHLVLHRFGFFVIESKSVFGRLSEEPMWPWTGRRSLPPN